MEAKKAKVNREFKDGMFRTLFNDKEKMLELYNAVSEEQMGKEAIDDIETLTIETPLYIGSRNDLAFLIDGKSMFFCEQQSTRSGNMALRLSSYFGKTLDMMFGSEIYGTRKLKMAPPSFFVLIFGDKDTPELQVEPLSRHFTENAPENSIELVVNVYNICYSENNRLLKRSKTLREYSMFIYFVNEYLDREMSLEEAVAASVKRAKNEGTEVEGMLTGITVEKYGEVMKKEGFEDGRAAGLEQGRSEGIAQGEASGRAEREIEMAKALKAKGVSIDIIAETSGLPKEEIEQL